MNRNSQNSSKPPSTDGFGRVAKGKGQKAPREQGRQGAPREARKLYPSEDCRAVHEVIPPVCQGCGAHLSDEDSHPHRHQVIQVPPVKPDVVEYRSSFGSQSKEGSLFVSRMLTVVTSLKAQQCHVLDFLTQSCTALGPTSLPLPCFLTLNPHGILP